MAKMCIRDRCNIVSDALAIPRYSASDLIREYNASLVSLKMCIRDRFYDLMDNMVRKYEPSATTTGANVVQGIASGCLSEHDCTFYSDLDSTAEEVVFENVNPVDAILGDGGLVEDVYKRQAHWWIP